MTLLESSDSQENNQSQDVNTQEQQLSTDVSNDNHDGEVVMDSQEKVAEWYFDENMPMDGPRPPELSAKFKTAMAQIRAYNDAEKYIGNLKQRLGGFTGKPEDGYKFDESAPNIKSDDPIVKEFVGIFEKYNASNEFANELAKVYAMQNQKPVIDKETEIKKIGPQYQQIKSSMQNALKNYSNETQEVIKSMVTNADQMIALKEILDFSSIPAIPTGYNNYDSMPSTLKEAQDAYANETDQSKLKNHLANIARIVQNSR